MRMKVPQQARKPASKSNGRQPSKIDIDKLVRQGIKERGRPAMDVATQLIQEHLSVISDKQRRDSLVPI
jgi:hypothetical protein